MKIVKLVLVCFTLIILSLCSCKKNLFINRAHVIIKLTDKPIAGLKEVNVDIREIQYHTNGGNQTSGWSALTTLTGVYNLLKLVNGLDTIIAQGEVPIGKISQIRFILGNSNTLKDSLGNVYPLTIPSGSESGSKIQLNETLVKDVEYTFLLDFDVAQSIVSTGANTYQLKPVIKLIIPNTNGSIKGVVFPAASSPVVTATSGSDSASTKADANGNYIISGLDVGTYQVKFYPVLPYSDSIRSGINITTGVVTTLDTLKF